MARSAQKLFSHCISLHHKVGEVGLDSAGVWCGDVVCSVRWCGDVVCSVWCSDVVCSV